MNTVRAFVERLSAAVDDGSNSALSVNHRRIVVPAAAHFSLEGTILRTLPVQTFQRPGHSAEVIQLLEWLDITSSNDGYDLAINDLGIDLTACLALAAGRRIDYAVEWPMKHEDSPTTTFFAVGHAYDSELLGPPEGGLLGRFEMVVRSLTALPERQATALLGAIRMRNAASCLVESDYSSAYGLLVAALETLSQAFASSPNSWEVFHDSLSWDKWIEVEGLDSGQADRLRSRLLGMGPIRIKQTFVEYVVAGLDPQFWKQSVHRFVPDIVMGEGGAREGEGRWEVASEVELLVPSNSEDLRSRLRKTYDARSKFIHESLRPSQIALFPVPGIARQPLGLKALRRVLEYLLWKEIHGGSDVYPMLPDLQLFHRQPS